MFPAAKKRFAGLVAPALSALMCAWLPASAQNNNTVAIEAVKMNVLYIGVDNPIRIAASGVPAEDLQVKFIGEGAITGGNGDYTVRATRPGEAIVRLERKSNQAFIAEQKYRVKRIPDPAPRLDGRYSGGSITKEKLLASSEMKAVLDNFDFDAICQVSSFTLTVLPKGRPPVTIDCTGGQIPSSAAELFKQLEGKGDAVFIDDIKVTCPGDTAVRNIGGAAFKINPE